MDPHSCRHMYTLRSNDVSSTRSKSSTACWSRRCSHHFMTVTMAKTVTVTVTLTVTMAETETVTVTLTVTMAETVSVQVIVTVTMLMTVTVTTAVT